MGKAENNVQKFEGFAVWILLLWDKFYGRAASVLSERTRKILIGLVCTKRSMTGHVVGPCRYLRT